MSNEMIERVARAIEKSAKDCGKGSELFKTMAKDAIEAMREPTEEMIGDCPDPDYVITKYKSMIDAALKEEE